MAKGLLKAKLTPRVMLPKDDAFHGSKKLIASEWWYFDAIFSNKYSIHVDFTTFTKKHKIASSAIEIYKNGKLKVKAIKRHLYEDIEVSKKIPFVKLNGNKIMDFDLDRFKKKGEWVYNFSNKIENNEVNLTFIGKNKGFKFETDAESWAVALPRAQVKGEISIKGKKIKVEGLGYHDHNWNSTISSVFDIWGWYWGKVSSKTFNLVWAYVMHTPRDGIFRGIFNKDNKGFFYINPKKVIFNTKNFTRRNGRKIPTKFNIKINDICKNIPIKADININIKQSHFKSVIFFPYWRHHVKVTGFLSVDNHREELDCTHIMESFRIL